MYIVLIKNQAVGEGVLDIKEKNTELLFVTLEKTEEKYSPTTMYDDYAINEKACFTGNLKTQQNLNHQKVKVISNTKKMKKI